jgi:hypothetical protein
MLVAKPRSNRIAKRPVEVQAELLKDRQITDCLESIPNDKGPGRRRSGVHRLTYFALIYSGTALSPSYMIIYQMVMLNLSNGVLWRWATSAIAASWRKF